MVIRTANDSASKAVREPQPNQRPQNGTSRQEVEVTPSTGLAGETLMEI
jgi:hypothetical protein